jgi:hypothetical protein
MVALLMLLPLLTQNTSQTIPRTPDGKPDLNGVWERPYVPDMSRSGANQQGPGKLPFTAWGEDDFKTYDVTKFDYTGHCLPQGLTRSMNSPFPIEIFQTAKRVAVLYEAWNVFHVIPIDGRSFPKNVEPTWMGTSIGKWDGGTLVVDTIGFNGKTRLDTVGHPLTEQLHVTERYTRSDLKHITYEVTVDDPKAYSTLWKNVRTFTLRPDWEIMEYSCEENNRDLTEGHIK